MIDRTYKNRKVIPGESFEYTTQFSVWTLVLGNGGKLEQIRDQELNGLSFKKQEKKKKLKKV